MTADENDFVGTLAAANFCDDIRRRNVRQCLRRQHEMHAHALTALETEAPPDSPKRTKKRIADSTLILNLHVADTKKIQSRRQAAGVVAHNRHACAVEKKLLR